MQDTRRFDEDHLDALVRQMFSLPEIFRFPPPSPALASNGAAHSAPSLPPLLFAWWPILAGSGLALLGSVVLLVLLAARSTSPAPLATPWSVMPRAVSLQPTPLPTALAAPLPSAPATLVLVLPSPGLPPVPTPAPTPRITIYTVQPGDTLGGIAARYGVTVAALIGANNLTSANTVYAGQQLVIPPPDYQPPAWAQQLAQAPSSTAAPPRSAPPVGSATDPVPAPVASPQPAPPTSVAEPPTVPLPTVTANVYCSPIGRIILGGLAHCDQQLTPSVPPH